MDKISLQLIIDKLDKLSVALYDERIDKVDASFEIDEVIGDLNGWLLYLHIGNAHQVILDGLTTALNSDNMDEIKSEIKSLINYVDFGCNGD